MNDVVLTKAWRKYYEYYKNEIEMNEHFNAFVGNYRLAYQGPNTLQAQIGTKLKGSNTTRV